VTEDSKNNDEATFCYDKLRRAELRRNIWTFATRRVILRPIDTTTYLLDPADWDATVTYLPGSIVKDDNGSLWQSMVADNLNLEPGASFAWESYFGPMTVHEYDDEIAYSAGELVYQAGANPGGYVVYMSLENENDDDPETGVAYDATVTYKVDDVVTYSGSNWRSLIELNLGTTPADAPAPWDETATYGAADTVTGSDGYIYSSIAGSNVAHDPTETTGYWTNTNVPAAWDRTPVLQTAATTWRPIFAAIRSLTFQYPIGTGPVTQTSSRNVYRLPAGFIRKAPTDPKAGSFSPLGAPAGLDYDTKDIEGDFLVSPLSGPIMLRFVADITEVTKMDDMFCEGLAARMAYEMCEAITQSTAKQAALGAAYNKFMGEARMVNAVELGPIEPPEDDFITCRR
jgi:hypothetical protein